MVTEARAFQTLLGIRFWDAAADRMVVEGLRVFGQLLHPDGNRRVGRRVLARLSRGGVYAFFDLHPIAEERVALDDMLWEHAPTGRSAVVDVEDPLRRYLPLSFAVPSPVRGAFTGAGGWPGVASPVAPAGGSGVRLWPAASYARPPGQAAIYAQLVVGNAKDPPPAAYAVVQVLRPKGNGSSLEPHGYGIADDQGRLMLPLPYPIPRDTGTPGVYPALGSQTFDLTVRVFFKAGPLPHLPGSVAPDLKAILEQKPSKIAFKRDGTMTLKQQLPVTLAFETPLVLRTNTADPARPEPFLRIQP